MPQHKRYNDNAQRQAAYRDRIKQAREQQLAAKGLPPLPAIPTIPGYSRWKRNFAEIQYRLETTHDEMQDYYDQRLDQWRQSDQAVRMEQHLQTLTEVIQIIQELQD